MKIKQKKGSILAFAVILMSFMLVIAISLAFASLSGRKNVNVSSNSTTAFQKTDEGIELLLFSLFNELKPFDSLKNLAEAIGDGYKCEVIENTAVIVGEDFKIISYKEVSPEDNDERKELGVIERCETEIARISKIKVSGNFSNATRSIEVNLDNSLGRGRIARWDFEDNAQSVRAGGCGSRGVGSPIVKDSSKEGDYILTLCPIEGYYEDDESPNDLPGTMGATTCPLWSATDGDKNKGFYMNHLTRWYKEGASKPDNAGECFWGKDGVDYQISCGAYVSGIYDSSLSGKGAGTGSNEPIADSNTEPKNRVYEIDCRTGSEALEFNGVSNYLAPNLEDSSADTDSNGNRVENQNFVNDSSRDNLNLDGKEGFSISLWVNNNSETGNEEKEVLVSKLNGNKGYEIYLKDNKVYFSVNGKEISANLDEDNFWHHIVARYDKDNDRSGVLVDGGKEVGFRNFAAGPVKDNKNTPLFIGGVYKGDKKNKFEINKFDSAFGGMLDQVEIYNRYLIDFEVQKLCHTASGKDWMLGGNKVSDLCDEIKW